VWLERDWVDLEICSPGERFDLGARWTNKTHVQPRPCESQTEMQRRCHRPRSAPLMEHLHDG
jgi:hypothetical protein